nr:MAG TPA: helix-turn-helix domain protein [Caudoviricetes sp.]
MSEINTRIAAVIQASGLTKTAFAERLNVSQSFISRLAIGASVPSDRTIVDICREFGVSEQWLRTGEGEMFVRLSREEEITKFLMTVIRDPDSEFQRQLLATMAKLEPAQWKLMEQMLDDLISQREKKEGT